MVLYNCMNRRLKNFISAVAISYISLYFVSAQIANFALAVFFVLLIPGIILRQLFLNKLYRHSIKMVSRQFVISDNALHNDHCTVIYTPDEKIVVMDNLADRTHAKRMFTLLKRNVNINKSWNRVCRVFDSFITLDSLAAFYSYDTKIDIITLEAKVVHTAKKEVIIEKTNEGPKFVEMDNIRPDTYVVGTDKPNDKGAAFVEIDSIQEQKPTVERPKQADEFHEMVDIMSKSPNKIDVNSATSSELSVLPGINIVMAKKIIEYRNTNGLFNTEDDFIKAANVKEHFVKKIKSMIVAGKPVEHNDDDDQFEGRVVDF